jgi:hypothetical protein
VTARLVLLVATVIVAASVLLVATVVTVSRVSAAEVECMVSGGELSPPARCAYAKAGS